MGIHRLGNKGYLNLQRDLLLVDAMVKKVVRTETAYREICARYVQYQDVVRMLGDAFRAEMRRDWKLQHKTLQD